MIARRKELEKVFAAEDSTPQEKAEAAKYLAVFCQKEGDLEKGKGNLKEAEQHYGKAGEYLEEGWKADKHNEKLITDYAAFLQERNKPLLALALYSEALKKNPRMGNLFRLRASLLASLGNWTAALQDSQSFLTFAGLNEKQAIFSIQMHDLAGNCCMELKQYEEAGKHFQKAYKLDYNDVKRRVEFTRKLLKARLFAAISRDRSEEFLEKKMEGAVALAEKNSDKALKVLCEMLELGELTPSFLCRLLAARAQVHLMRNDLVSAQIDLERLQWQVLPNAPESDRPAREMDLHLGLALVCLKKGVKDKAREHFLKGWEQGRNKKAFVLAYLELLKAEQNYEEAAKVCAESQQALGKTNALFLQAEFYFEDQKWSLAKEACDLCLEEKPSDPQLRLKALNLAVRASKKIDPSSQRNVEDALEIAASLEPKEALEVLNQICFERLTFLNFRKALLIRAEAHMDLSNFSSAHKDIETAQCVIFGPLSMETEMLGFRAKLCALEGNGDEALNLFDEGWKRGDPTSRFVHQYLTVLFQRKEFSKALSVSKDAYYGGKFDLFEYYHWKILIHFEAKNWDEVILLGELLLPYTRDNPKDRLATLEKLVEPYIKVGQYSNARSNMLKICRDETADPSCYLYWMEKLQEISKSSTLYEHLKELTEDAREDKKMPLLQKIAYLKEIRLEYQDEFSEWRRAKLSWVLGICNEEASRLEEAIKEYQIALEIMEKEPIWYFKQIEDVKERIEKAKMSIPRSDF